MSLVVLISEFNIVKKAKELMKKEVYLIVGEFRELGVKKVVPSHCICNSVREAFAEEYKEDFIKFGVGKIMKLSKYGFSLEN